MKRSLKLLAASLAAVTAMTFASVGASAYKIKTIDGVRYKYSDDGKKQLGKYNGWTTLKSGAKYYYKDGVRIKDTWLKMNGKRTYYFGSDGKMATGELILGTKIYYFGQDGRVIYGIEAKGSRASRSGIMLTLNGIALGDDKVVVSTGQAFGIERLTASGKWEAQPVLYKQNQVFTDLGVKFFSEGRLVQRTEELNWESIYGKLDAGEYRLTKTYTVKLPNAAKYEQKTLYIPFTVKVVDTAEAAWGINMSVSEVTTDGLAINITQNSNYVGDVSWSGGYTLEIQEKTGEWSEVNKAARKKAVFPDLDVIFSNSSAKAKGDVEVNSARDKIDFYTGELSAGHYRIKRIFTGNCNNVKGTLPAYAEFDITADTPNSWGVSFGCESDASETGITLYAGVTSASTANIYGDIWTGEDYEIEHLGKDGDWEALEPVTEDGEIYWNDLGIILPENDTRKLTVNWSSIYGKLAKGTYRISKTFYSYGNSSLNPPAVSRTMYCTFTIDAGSVNIGDYTLDVSVTKASAGSLTLALTRSGKYSGSVYWDHGFDIYKKNSKGVFKLYKSTSAINGSDYDTVDLPLDRTVKTVLDVSSHYPDLTAGTYRIKLKITDQTGHLKYANADFIIS